MSNLHAAVRRVAHTLGHDADQNTVNHVVGTLKIAGVTEDNTGTESIIKRELKRLFAKMQPEAVSTTAASEENVFSQIDHSLKQGNCPRCGKKMVDVLLADYTPARFCKGECRITLWSSEE